MKFHGGSDLLETHAKPAEMTREARLRQHHQRRDRPLLGNGECPPLQDDLGAEPSPRLRAFVELFGAYLIGRILITDAREYKRYFIILGMAFAVLLPFVLLEMATGFNTVRTIFGTILGMPARQHNLGPRLGPWARRRR